MRQLKSHKVVWGVALTLLLTAIDSLAIVASLRAKNHFKESSVEGVNGFMCYKYFMYDDSIIIKDFYYETRLVIRRVVARPASMIGRLRVWWPLGTGVGITLLTIAIAGTGVGRRLISVQRGPRLSVRMMMLVVALLAWPILAVREAQVEVEKDLLAGWCDHYARGVTWGHELPYWPRFWRELLGTAWLGDYKCDHPETVAGRGNYPDSGPWD